MIYFTEPITKATAPKFPPLGPTERAIKDALLSAVSKIRDLFTAARVVGALDMNDVDGAIEIIRFEEGEELLMSSLPTHLRKAYELAGTSAAESLSRELKFSYHFDIINERSVAWLRNNIGALIAEWGRSSRAALRDMIERGFTARLGSAEVARRIRDSGIGLTTRLQGAVDRYRQTLTDKGYAADKVARMTERYYQRLLRYRAEMIARTELARATTAAQQEAWKQAIEQGLLDPNRMEQEWLTRIDPRTCPLCLEMDGKRAAAPNGMFRTDDGQEVSPPRHVQCRCTTALVPIGSPHGPSAPINVPGGPGIRPLRSLRA